MMPGRPPRRVNSQRESPPRRAGSDPRKSNTAKARAAALKGGATQDRDDGQVRRMRLAGIPDDAGTPATAGKLPARKPATAGRFRPPKKQHSKGKGCRLKRRRYAG